MNKISDKIVKEFGKFWSINQKLEIDLYLFYFNYLYVQKDELGVTVDSKFSSGCWYDDSF